MHDVIVIGAGPAGASAARQLAASGRTVLVLERERFPRFHIGESLLPYNEPLFAELGLSEELAQSDLMVKRAAQFTDPSGEAGARLQFANGDFTEHPTAYQVERSQFDQRLLEHARAAGAEVREQHRVTDWQREEDRIQVAALDEVGERKVFHGRFVVDASGSAAITSGKRKLRRSLEAHRKVAVFAHFDGVEMPQGEEQGDIIIVVGDEGWNWLIPLSEARTSVGLVLERERFLEAGRDAERMWAEALARTPVLARRLATATRVGDLRVVVDYSYHVEELVEERLLRIGDAAGFLDPIFSSGVMLAMKTGLQASEVIGEALDSKVPLTRGMRNYERSMRRHMRLFWRFIEAFYTPAFRDVFLQPQPTLNMLSAVNAVLAGRDRLPLRVRWRLELFFLVVRLQKWLPIVPRVTVSGATAEGRELPMKTRATC